MSNNIMETADPMSRPGSIRLDSDPSPLSTAFRGVLPYTEPKGEAAAYIWRKRMLIEATTGLVNLEPWEKVVILAIIIAIPLCFAFNLLPPVVSVVSLWFWRTWDFLGYVLTYPGLFVRIEDPLPLEGVQQFVSRNMTRAL